MTMEDKKMRALKFCGVAGEYKEMTDAEWKKYNNIEDGIIYNRKMGIAISDEQILEETIEHSDSVESFHESDPNAYCSPPNPFKLRAHEFTREIQEYDCVLDVRWFGGNLLLVNDIFVINIRKKQWREKGKLRWYYYSKPEQLVSEYIEPACSWYNGDSWVKGL